MNNIRISWVAVAAAFLGLGCGRDSSNPNALRTAHSPTESVAPKDKLWLNPDWEYRGIVSALGSNWVELGVGWTSPKRGPHLKQRNDDPNLPKRLLAAGAMVGGDPRELTEPTYRLIDLKVADVVYIITAVDRAGTEYCLMIVLKRRPGGKIPKFPFQLTQEDELCLHVRNQAEQDWEEKGIPIPKRFLDMDGRAPWTNPPYPPVAPHPRDKTPLDPIVAP